MGSLKDTNEEKYEKGFQLGLYLRYQDKERIALGTLEIIPEYLSFCQGLMVAGVDIISLGVLPKEVFSFALNYLKIDSGILLSSDKELCIVDSHRFFLDKLPILKDKETSTELGFCSEYNIWPAYHEKKV